MKEKQKQRAESAEGVMVSTLHSVKGLEYDKVYLLDVNEGVMPYQKAVLCGGDRGGAADVLRRNDARPERADALLCGGTV